MDPTDCYITVQDSELLTGQLDKAALGMVSFSHSNQLI
jgi:hypothetical protein